MATVDLGRESIRLLAHDQDKPPTWRKIVRKEDIEGWLLRHNKKYHQQVYDDNSPHVTGTIGEIFGDEETINNIIEGHTHADDLDIPDYVKDWFRALTKTPAK